MVIVEQGLDRYGFFIKYRIQSRDSKTIKCNVPRNLYIKDDKIGYNILPIEINMIVRLKANIICHVIL